MGYEEDIINYDLDSDSNFETKKKYGFETLRKLKNFNDQ